MDFIDIKAQLKVIRNGVNRRIQAVLEHGQFIMGPEVEELEEKLANLTQTRHCITCANGTDALQIALMALDIGPDDIVFTPAFSFFATAEAIALVGATPYFVDINPDTYNICPHSLSTAIKQARISGIQPKAVIAVDMFGLAANYPTLKKICAQENLSLIEDGAQGFGGSLDKKPNCSFGDISTTSFFPAKPLGCFGDGGALFTDNDHLAEICKSIRSHGQGDHKYQNVRIGLNSRLDTLQASILLEKLKIFDVELQNRQTLSEFYRGILSSTLKCPAISKSYHSPWAQYSVLAHDTKERQDLRSILNAQHIPTNIYYPTPLNEQPPMKHHPSTETPHTEYACSRIFSLPMHGYMTSSDYDKLGGALRQLNG